MLEQYEALVNLWLLWLSNYQVTYDFAPKDFNLARRFVSGKTAKETATEILVLIGQLTQPENALIM